MNKDEWDAEFKDIDERKNKEVSRMYDLNNYPEHLRDIVQVILDDGEMLSDGIIYYARYNEIFKFAEDIYSIIKDKK